ncbi:MAG: ImmA/IrrE family metallo-endopeptidase [Rhizomicrobium sp.]|jgi:hypothetical protein
MITTASALDISLRPLQDRERQTTYQLAIAIDGETVWPVCGETKATLEIQIDDLLAYLTEFWKPLMLGQVFPIAVSPLRPSDLRREAEHRWAGMQPATIEKEEDLVSSFEEAHDIATAFGGIFDLPHFWMMRSANQMILETANTVWHLPFEVARTSLRSVGDEISKHLAKVDSERWDKAIEAWQRRDASDDIGLLAWSVGIARNLAEALIAEGNLKAPRDFEDAANDYDELRIAARMAGALPPEQIRSILGLARQFSGHDAAKLRGLANECMRYVAERFTRKPPFVQGEAAALFAREKLGIPNDGRVDIFDVADDLAIAVHSEAAEPTTFDGLAIWGDHYGPGVFLNAGSLRVGDRNIERIEDDFATRVTLAHELCHLLLDGDHALSAVEVLKARMPVGVEARARAFAGEFLLPTEAAARIWLQARRPTDRATIIKIVDELTKNFGVTRSVATWKLQHGAALHDVDLETILDIVVPHRYGIFSENRGLR